MRRNDPTVGAARTLGLAVTLLVVVAAPAAMAAPMTGPADGSAALAASTTGLQTQSWTTNLTAKAESDTRLGVRSDLAAADGTVFVSGASIGNNELFALRSGDGSVEWSRTLGPGVPEGLSAPARVAGRTGRWTGETDWSPENVFVGDYAGTLHALDAESGSTTWTASTGFGSYVGDPLLGDRVVYATAYDPATGTTYLQAFDASDGSRLWSTELGEGIGIAAPTGTADRLVVAVGSTVYAVDAASGSVEWTAGVGSPVFAAAAVEPGTGTVVVAADDGSVTAMSLETGDKQWQRDVGESATMPVLAGDSVVVGGDGLHAFDPSDGTSRWTAEIGTVTAAPTVENGQIHAATTGPVLHTVNATSGESVDSVTLSDFDAPVRAAPAVLDGVVVADATGQVSGLGTEGPRDPSRTKTTDGDAPGFGMAAAILALLGMLVARRVRAGE